MQITKEQSSQPSPRRRKFSDEYRVINGKEELISGTKYKKALMKSYNALSVVSFIYLGPCSKNPELFSFVPLVKGISTRELQSSSYDELFNNTVVWGGFLKDDTLRELLLTKTNTKQSNDDSTSSNSPQGV